MNPHATFFLAAAVLVAAVAFPAFCLGAPAFLGVLGGINLATLALYGYDKAVAGGRRTRVPEAILHTLALLGGTIAAFLAQQLFRHKTVKGSFQVVFWLIAVLQIGLVAAWIWCWKARPAWMPDVLFPRP